MTTKVELFKNILDTEEVTLRFMLVNISMSNIGQKLVADAFEFAEGLSVRNRILDILNNPVWSEFHECNRVEKVKAIKEHRRITNSSLMASKLYVEQLMEDVGISY